VQTTRDELWIKTAGDGEVIDLTGDAQQVVAARGVRDGLCTVFVAHSTCGVTTIEAEPGCNADLNTVLDGIAPAGARWLHNERNADTNGHSHVRAALIGPSVTVPVHDGTLDLGTWQRIMCVDFDDRPRSRRVVVQLMGV